MKCEVCEEIAENLCLNCNKYYCKSCFKYIHEKKKNKNHKKENIDLDIPIATKCPIHTDVPMNLFCINEKELCCSLCQIINPHEDHKLILIDDEEALKKENLTFEASSEEFDKNNEILLKKKSAIEKE